MKKTLVSIAAASLIVSSAMAADKGIDIVTTGQAVVYYQTAENNGNLNNVNGKDTKLFDADSSNANVGIQLNLDADLKNGFTFGSQLTYLDALGLNKNLVGDTNVMQIAGSTPNTQAAGATSTTNDLALTKIFIAKKIANTTVKVGRQALPKSLSPLAFSEDWNVFQNTFEAALVINSDIPDTTVVGAYVGGGNQVGNLSAMDDLTVKGQAGSLSVNSTAYMLTVQNTSLPMTTITASYYDLARVAGMNGGIGATAVWGDIAVADKSLPMGLKIGVQGGQIDPDSMLGTTAVANTSALGVKVGLAPIENLTLCAAYTSVDGDDNKANVSFQNTGGVKTPLYTQMIANQTAIALDADTFMLKIAYAMGDMGTVIAQGTSTAAGKSNLDNRTAGVENDYTDLELVYKVKAGGVDFLAAYVNQSWDKKDTASKDNNNIVRIVARYNF